MCHIKNSLPVKHKVPSKELSQDFDSWFKSLHSDLNKNKESLPPAENALLNDMFLPIVDFPQVTITPDFYSMVSDIAPVDILMQSPPIPFQYPSPQSIGSVASPKTVERMASPPAMLITPPPETISTKRELQDDEDVALVKKRQRQNEAAKRCREKKLNQLQAAEQQVQKFEKEKFEMAVKLAVLEKERDAWEIRERDLQQHIQSLRMQLDESQTLLLKCAK
ncbi:hypothetical protein BC833DRAFT_567745 [Globomyces pollinis-pini]|nr:hypothetical protein BC833DRAFT_567745 [Globomyces pollinis-pini]